MDPCKELEDAALCITGLCTRMEAGAYSVRDGIRKICTYTETIEARGKDAAQIIRDLRQRNCTLNKTNWQLTTENGKLKQSVEKAESELQSSQLSLSAILGGSDDEETDMPDLNAAQGESSQTLFSEPEEAQASMPQTD